MRLVIISLIFLASQFVKADLASRQNAELRNPTIEWSVKSANFLEDHSIVFIGGIFSELFEEKYFMDNEQALKLINPHVNIYKIFPSTRNTVERNANIIYAQILSLAWNTHKPLLIIAHSKGAAEVMQMFLQHPKLAEIGLVDKVVFVNGAFGGSYLADAFKEDIPEFLHIDSLCMGILSTSTRWSKSRVNAGISRLSSQQALLLRSIFYYVRTALPYIDLPEHFQTTQRIIDEESGGKLSDGIIALEDQYIENFGTDMGILAANHAALVSGWDANGSRLRLAFTRALILELVR